MSTQVHITAISIQTAFSDFLQINACIIAQSTLGLQIVLFGISDSVFAGISYFFHVRHTSARIFKNDGCSRNT
jgi:hypothetical protein